MDPDGDTQPTQQATQTVLDPRRLGKQNSGFSDEDISDIICLLVPYSDNARREVSRLAMESSQHMVAREDGDSVDLDEADEDDAGRFGLRGFEENAIALKLSARVKDPLLGFTFGRNAQRCDICFVNDPLRRLSNTHFRIFINEYGVLMLEDQSTNGTVVEGTLLKARSKHATGPTRRILTSGNKISILMHEDSCDLVFLVRVPRRDGDYEIQYRKNLVEHRKKLQALVNKQDQDISAGPAGHVDLFPQRPKPATRQAPKFNLPDDTAQEGSERLTKEWNGSEKYNRVGQIGKGAFATVHKVTSKFDGKPYAAKELDKQRFMKNGAPDQKVENEMKIMQNIQHPNIVRYIEHLDWENRLFIIIMEFVPGGDLGGFINNRGRLPEEAVQVMAKQLLDALEYLHHKNITHRDIKPDNILIGSQQPFVVKLTDFGLSKMIENDQTFLRTFCGTLLYCAPEVYSEFTQYDEHGRRNPRNRYRRATAGQRYGHAVDIWSLGGVLFYALTGKPPYPVRIGISYSELLHQIMTEPLDIIPLLEAGVSRDGIDFLMGMLQRWPEKRATIEELQSHAWLGAFGYVTKIENSQSYDGISNEDLEHGASQLSLVDRQADPDVLSDDEILDDEDDIHPLDFEEDSEKENNTFGRGGPPRLFGEVGSSAIGSSGAIPEFRLNLPVSESSFGETEILGSEVRDSFESDENSTPKKTKSQSSRGGGGARLSRNKSHSVDELNNMTFDVESQSLGGTESILENLNMKSVMANLNRSNSEFTSSKRKPAPSDPGDESDGGGSLPEKPSIKRLKSESNVDSTSALVDEDEYHLYAMVPAVSRMQSGRQIDSPVHKSLYWTAGDSTTWHLRYPEMTQLQYDAFQRAAVNQGEEFHPGGSALWAFAMKHFPPEDISADSNKGASRRSEIVSTLGPDESAALPELLPPESQYDAPDFLDSPQKRPVAGLQSSSRSVIAGISVFVTESITTWGRHADNTRVYPAKAESRVPKFAFKILLWKDGFDPSKDLRPWNRPSAADASAFHFYLSTKATGGIIVNDVMIPSHEAKNSSGPSKHWIRIHDGDLVVIWRQGHKAENQVELVFRCTWGGSAKPRARLANGQPAPPTPVPDVVARRLDEVCMKTERRIAQRTEQQLKMEEADQDVAERSKHIDRERHRSDVFEVRRQIACRELSMRDDRKPSPTSAPAVVTHAVPGTRTVATFRPARHQQTQ